MTKAEQAAAMRKSGKTAQQVAKHFGWRIETARSLISRGKKMDDFRRKHRDYQRSVYSRP